MIASPDRLRMSAPDYLEWESQQPIKYEYLNGEAYAMTGGTLPHNDIAVNLTTALKAHLRGTGCKVRMADAKVGIAEQGPYFYPDLVVSCDERDRRAMTMVRYPCLIVEVLSPTTEGFDRGDKFRYYRRLPTLQEYVLINFQRMGVEVYRLNEHHKWELTPYLPEESMSEGANEFMVQFTSLKFTCPLSLIYDDVELVER